MASSNRKFDPQTATLSYHSPEALEELVETLVYAMRNLSLCLEALGCPSDKTAEYRREETELRQLGGAIAAVRAEFRDVIFEFVMKRNGWK